MKCNTTTTYKDLFTICSRAADMITSTIKKHTNFCFSNIFPATETLEKNDLRTLIISSPNSGFIAYIDEVLQKPSNTAKIMKIGCMRFMINYTEKLIQKIPDNVYVTLITGTPIIVRIPNEKCKEYRIETKKNYAYIYWRSEYPIDLFVSQVENNLLKKYVEYHKLKNTKEDDSVMTLLQQKSSFSFFQKFKFKKQISTRISMKDSNEVVIGTVWEFGSNVGSNRDIIEFALDVGLGERNSLSFGFMNLNK